ncbi:MAG: molybdopterin molybdotransferase MoeA [Alcaligenaceae bacterium]|nr:molybdopterin molybdotransferase MoeA [Alcaligenaceae bacterium]
MSELLDYHLALNSLLEIHQPLEGEEEVALAQLGQRVLARDLMVQHDVPTFDNSAMDGYAINGNDCDSWQVVQRIAAGDEAQQGLQHGQAARIFTGAPIPAGATAVLIQENVTLDAERNVISHTAAPGEKAVVKAGQNIRRQAEELRKGEPLLARHQRITPAAIGLLSTQGYTHAPCVPQPRVTVFSSGNELVPPGQPLQPGKIYDSNRQMLSAMLQAEGFIVIDGGILPDSLEPTRQALEKAARKSDAILCSGGVSVGEEDHLKNALEQVGELTQWRLFIKPGKPITWGSIGACRVFMLPGNPVSSLVTFRQLALPALQRMAGLPVEQARPWKFMARAGFSRGKVEPRREFLRVVLESSPDGFRVKPMALQGSNMLSGAVFATALAEIPPGTKIEEGIELAVYPLADRF